jgi:hypothetical protein
LAGSQGAAGTSNPLKKAALGAMAPPSGVASRSQFPAANGSASPSAGVTNADSNSATRAASSLFTSILAPPPSKHARTILNAGDPFVPAPVRPAPSPQPRVAKSIAEGTRAHAKSQAKHSPSSPSKRKAKRGGDKRRAGGVDADGDVDMKAAATLTSLLLSHHRPVGGASPRSSVDAGSDAGSTHSQPPSQFAAGSSRDLDSQPTMSSVMTAATEATYRVITPPPTSGNSVESQTTPRPAPTDNEAADLMLFLATSPSPNRRSGKEAAEALRGLGSSAALRAKGRVLFASTNDAEPGGSRSTTPRIASALSRGDSFASSISSIGGEMRPAAQSGSSKSSNNDGSSSSQLLPPPQVSNATNQPTYRKIQDAPSPRPSSATNLDFNIHDFINASPAASPSRQPAQKANLGLRADVGRRLFEEEQMRMGANASGPVGPAKMPEPPNSPQKALGASIDLAQS